jgi:hypothetical protein
MTHRVKKNEDVQSGPFPLDYEVPTLRASLWENFVSLLDSSIEYLNESRFAQLILAALLVVAGLAIGGRMGALVAALAGLAGKIIFHFWKRGL